VPRLLIDPLRGALSHQPAQLAVLQRLKLVDISLLSPINEHPKLLTEKLDRSHRWAKLRSVVRGLVLSSQHFHHVGSGNCGLVTGFSHFALLRSLNRSKEFIDSRLNVLSAP
jgi:hypothetical protein